MNRAFKAAVAALILAVGFSGWAVAGPQEDAASALLRGDYATAVRLFRTLADQGNARAQSALAVMYADGRGVTQNYGVAVNWYRKAADQGDAMGQAGLGTMYMTGQGVPKDYAAAVIWFRKAADQGNALAQSYLGALYFNGEGVPQDYVIAHMWLNLGAAGGDDHAAEWRNMVAAKMTPAQIAEAQKLAREWKPKSNPR